MRGFPAEQEPEIVRRQMDQALREFGTPVVPVDPPEVALARRTRTVAHLRALQARAVVRRQNARSWRKRWLVAALVFFPTGALAATWAAFHEWSGGSGSVVAENAVHVTRPESAPGLPVRPSAAGVPSAAPSSPSVAGAGASLPNAAGAGPVVVDAADSESLGAQGSNTAPEAREIRTRTLASRRGSGVSNVGRRSPGSSSVTAATASFKSFTDGASPAGERSSLAAENALMQAAMGVARAGDDARAVLRFNDFLARYPGSPLAEDASVERARALARLRAPRSSAGSSSNAIVP